MTDPIDVAQFEARPEAHRAAARALVGPLADPHDPTALGRRLGHVRRQCAEGFSDRPTAEELVAADLYGYLTEI